MSLIRKSGHLPQRFIKTTKNLRPDIIKHSPANGVCHGRSVTALHPRRRYPAAVIQKRSVGLALSRSAQIFLGKLAGSKLTKPSKPVSSVSTLFIWGLFRNFSGGTMLVWNFHLGLSQLFASSQQPSAQPPANTMHCNDSAGNLSRYPAIDMPESW
jgi:hypothetical protein